MKYRPARLVAGALVALSVTSAAHAACNFSDVTSTKGSITGTFYAATGTVTKVKCALTLERSELGFASFEWGPDCPGLSTYGTSVFMNFGERQRIVKNSVEQKSCIISTRYNFDPQRMTFVSTGVASTVDTADPTALTKEKGTVDFTRTDGVFTGRYSVTFPVP